MSATGSTLTFEDRGARPPCPRCESLEVVRLIFGLPGPELWEFARNTGKVALGGCVIFWDYHRWACNTCDLDF